MIYTVLFLKQTNKHRCPVNDDRGCPVNDDMISLPPTLDYLSCKTGRICSCAKWA